VVIVLLPSSRVEGEREIEGEREKIYTSKCNMQTLYTQLYARTILLQLVGVDNCKRG
jgi:hypothetical protein